MRRVWKVFSPFVGLHKTTISINNVQNHVEETTAPRQARQTLSREWLVILILSAGSQNYFGFIYFSIRIEKT